MTQDPVTEDTLKAAAFLAELSADECAGWLISGFRALSGSQADQPPFEGAYTHLTAGDDITEDLTAAYKQLEPKIQAQFVRALGAAVRRFSMSDEIDHRAFRFALRLGARINAFGILPLIVKKSFGDVTPRTERLADLQALAIDVAVELTAGSAEPVDSLRDIINSEAFEDGVLISKAPALLLALCDVDGLGLVDHLFRLEDSLARHFQPTEGEEEDAVAYGRALLITDLGDHAPPHLLGGVINFALANRDWRLAWLGDALLSTLNTNLLAENDAARARRLIEKLRPTVGPVSPPQWVQLPRRRSMTRSEQHHISDLLSADTVEPAAQEEAYFTFIADFSGVHSAALGREAIEDSEEYE